MSWNEKLRAWNSGGTGLISTKGLLLERFKPTAQKGWEEVQKDQFTYPSPSRGYSWSGFPHVRHAAFPALRKQVDAEMKSILRSGDPSAEDLDSHVPLSETKPAFPMQDV